MCRSARVDKIRCCVVGACRFAARVRPAGGGVPRSRSARPPRLRRRRQPSRLAGRLDQERASAQPPRPRPRRRERGRGGAAGPRGPGGSLIFAVVRSVDEGRYACAAYSSLGAGRSSTTVRVYVRGRRYSLSSKLNTRKKGSPYSITERRVPELIPVLGSQPAGYVSHKPGGRLPLLSARTAVTLASLRRAATNFAAC